MVQSYSLKTVELSIQDQKYWASNFVVFSTDEPFVKLASERIRKLIADNVALVEQFKQGIIEYEDLLQQNISEQFKEVKDNMRNFRNIIRRTERSILTVMDTFLETLNAGM